MEKIILNNNFNESGYLINNYRSKKFGEKFLITTDHGSWVFLDKKDFDFLLKDKVDENEKLFNLLEDKGIVITKNNQEKIKSLLRERYEFLYSGPSLHIIVPTLRCNQKCIYCHASSEPENSRGFDMDKNTTKKVVDFIFQSPSKAITIEFQGGEPLLRFDIIKYIIEYANKLNKEKKKDLRFALVTNLTLMDEEKLDYLIKNNIGICTSLDGPEELHDKNRGLFCSQGSYSFVRRWIKKINEEYNRNGFNNRRVNALITVTKTSLEYMKKIIDEYINLGLKDIHLRFLNNLGDARLIWDKISYSPEEFIDFWKKAVDYILEKNKAEIFLRERNCMIILQKILTNKDPNYLEMRSPCGAAIGQLAYSYNGDIFTCDEARMINDDLFKLGNVKKDTFKEIIGSDQTCNVVLSSINDCQICDYCAYKPYCGVCPVCNFAEQGNIIAKIPETSRCKIYKEQFSYIFEKLKDSSNMKIFENWVNLN